MVGDRGDLDGEVGQLLVQVLLELLIRLRIGGTLVRGGMGLPAVLLVFSRRARASSAVGPHVWTHRLTMRRMRRTVGGRERELEMEWRGLCGLRDFYGAAHTARAEERESRAGLFLAKIRISLEVECSCFCPMIRQAIQSWHKLNGSAGSQRFPTPPKARAGGNFETLERRAAGMATT
jgi:hypothetical protein